MSQIQDMLRRVRLLHALFCVTIPLYLVLISLAPPLVERPVAPMIPLVIAGISATDVWIASRLRARLIPPSIDALEKDPEDRMALQNWRKGCIISFTHAMTLALFGLVIKFLGESWVIAGPFFGVAVLLLMIWRPKLEISSS
jgi:hypothetical protein